MDITLKALMISGPLTDDDVAELLTTLRQIEQRQPDKLYKAVATDLERDPSLKDMEIMLLDVFPRVPGAEPFVTITKRDDDISELSVITLKNPIYNREPDQVIPAGAKGTVVHIHESKSYLVEFTEPFPCVVSLARTDIER